MQGEASSRDSAAEGTGVPAFSVVIPYFNRSRSIAAALGGVPYGRVLGGAALTVVKNRLLRH